MASAEILYTPGRRSGHTCKVCESSMLLRNPGPGRKMFVCIKPSCSTVLYIYSLAMGDSEIPLDVWPHERPQGMPVGTYVLGLIRQIALLAA